MRGLLPVLVVCAVGCRERPPEAVRHEAYVWQRAWTGPVRAAVAGAPAEVGGLRVLVLEVAADGATAWPAVDVAALAAAARPVTAVVRIDGSRPVAVALGEVVARTEAWQRGGVDVVAIEIDHDCATAALGEYAAWLEAARPAGLRWSITALPTWAESPALDDVIAAVDEIVLQVHAVRAPVIFDAAQARAWVDAYAARAGDRTLRVALPTYRVAAGAADPVEVAGFVRDLEHDVVWFRLPVDGDRTAWSVVTLRAVIRGEPLAPDVGVELVARGPDVHDVVAENRGTLDAPRPAVRLDGDVVAADLVGDPRATVRAGERVVIGWVRGTEVTIHAP